MKYKLSDAEGFTPVSIQITLESQEEVDAFYGIFNHGWFTEAARAAGLDFGEIRNLVPMKDYSLPFERFERSLRKRFI